MVRGGAYKPHPFEDVPSGGFAGYKRFMPHCTGEEIMSHADSLRRLADLCDQAFALLKQDDILIKFALMLEFMECARAF